MGPVCLAALAMIVAGTGSTGGVAAVLIHKFRVKKDVKKMVRVGRSEWTHPLRSPVTQMNFPALWHYNPNQYK